MTLAAEVERGQAGQSREPVATSPRGRGASGGVPARGFARRPPDGATVCRPRPTGRAVGRGVRVYAQERPSLVLPPLPRRRRSAATNWTSRPGPVSRRRTTTPSKPAYSVLPASRRAPRFSLTRRAPLNVLPPLRRVRDRGDLLRDFREPLNRRARTLKYVRSASYRDNI